MAASERARNGFDFDRVYRPHKVTHPKALSNVFDSPGIEESTSDASVQSESESLPSSLETFLPPLQRRSPSSDRVSDSLRTTSWDETKKIGPARRSNNNICDKVDASSDHDTEEASTISHTPGGCESLGGDSSHFLTSYNHRASSPKLTAYDGNREIIDCYVMDPHLRQRLEAMRARNAKESYHHQLPPEDAPAHIQMMVLLYQWAAWALEISDQMKSERLIKWVNGRSMAFMMSGGRLPGYDLKELLVIAGVDPKELYGLAEEPGEQEKLMASMSSSQLAASIGEKQALEEQYGFTAEVKPKTETDLQQDNNFSNTAQGGVTPAAVTTPKKLEIDERDEDDFDKAASERDAVARGAGAINYEDASRNHVTAVPTPTSGMVYNNPADSERNGKRAGASDREYDIQVCYFFILSGSS